MSNMKAATGSTTAKHYLSFRIGREQLVAIDRVVAAEQKIAMYPYPRSAVVLKLLQMGIREYERQKTQVTR